MDNRKIIIVVAYFVLIGCTSIEKEKNSISSTDREIQQLIQELPSERIENSINPLRAKVFSVKNDSLRLNYIFEVAYHYYLENDSLNFRFWNNASFDLAKSSGNLNKLAEANWDLANFLYKQNVPDSAYLYYFNAHQLYKEAENKYYSARMLLNMGIMQEKFKDFLGSEVAIIEALNTFEELGKAKQLYISYNNLGIVFNGLEEWEYSNEYYKKSLDVAVELNDSILVAQTLNNIGVNYQAQKNYYQSLKYFNEALNIDSLFYKHTRLYSTLLDNKAYSIFKQNPSSFDYRELSERALQIRDSIDNKLGITINKIHLAEYDITEGDTVTAEKHLKEAKEVAEVLGNNEYILKTLLLLYDIDSRKSEKYIEEYLALTDSLAKEERRIRNKFARIRFETDEYIEETKVLTEQRLWIIVLGLFTTISLLLAYFYRAQRAKNKELMLEKAQQEANEQIYELLLDQHLKKEEGKQQERSRISSELHDGVLGKLFGIRMSMGFLDTRDQKKLSPYLNELQTLEKEIRDISHDLLKGSHDKESFTTIIENLIQEKSRITDINFKFRIEEVDFEGSPGSIQINIYRLLQEAIQNIIKHAEASEVSIVMEEKSNRLIIEIEDNGKGFEVEKIKSGIGLINMRDRTTKIHGTMKIFTSSQGTKIIFKIPLR